jgi:hypothetical protein
LGQRFALSASRSALRAQQAGVKFIFLFFVFLIIFIVVKGKLVNMMMALELNDEKELFLRVVAISLSILSRSAFYLYNLSHLHLGLNSKPIFLSGDFFLM